MYPPTGELPADPDLFLDEVLRWRPPLPVGMVDITEIETMAEGEEATEAGYAWERLPRWLAEIKDTFKKASDVPVLHLDLCSSLPLHAQMMRALEFKRSRERAHDIVGAVMHRDEPLEDPDLRRVDYAAKPRGAASGLVRELMESAVQEVLYTRNAEDMVQDDTSQTTDNMTARLVDQLMNQSTIYEINRRNEDYESRWQIKFEFKQVPQTYHQVIANLTIRSPEAVEAGERMAANGKNEADMALAKQTVKVGDELAEQYIHWQAANIARRFAGNNRYRPARFISIDNSDPIDIAVSSLANTPDSTRNMHLFSHAIASLFESHLHLKGDIFSPLAVPKNSVTLLTCFDGWPLHSSFEDMNDRDVERAVSAAFNVIKGWYGKLAYGGKMVIFPWAMRDRDERSQEALNKVRSMLSLWFGHGINQVAFNVATLKDLMSEADFETADHLSPIFASNSDVSSLIIEKPRKELVKRHAKNLGRRLLIASQSQG